MNRRNFIKQSCITCISGLALGQVLQGCNITHYTNGTLGEDYIAVPLTDFANKKEFRKYIVVQNENLKYPICVYRLDENNYSAIWLQCTHQGAELQVFGDKIQCPSHGSEFNSNGDVTQGPAALSLRKLPVIMENNSLKISLK